MWDLDSLIAQNNQAAIASMMDGEAVTVAQAPRPEAWPLSWLAARLQVGPPLLTEVVAGLTDIGALEGFLKLTRTFLPEYESDLLAQSRGQRVYRFCYLFGKKYFPLPVYGDISLVQLVDKMPVELLGMSYSAYHELDMRPGYLMLLSLVVYPYVNDERDTEDDDVPFDPATLKAGSKYTPRQSDIDWLEGLVTHLAISGQWIAPAGLVVTKVGERHIRLSAAADTPEVRETIRITLLLAKILGIEAEFKRGGQKAKDKMTAPRVPLLDKVARLVGQGLARRIPAEGWTPEELHQMLDGTKYHGAAVFADWACSQTACAILDSAYDGCEWQDGSFGPSFRWTKENVQRLTEDWPRVKAIRRTIDKTVALIEDNPNVVFRDLVEFLLAKAKALPKARRSKKREYDSVAHMCPLEVATDYDDEEAQNGY